MNFLFSVARQTMRPTKMGDGSYKPDPFERKQKKQPQGVMKPTGATRVRTEWKKKTHNK
jgi:hypothetical protein